MSHYFSRVQLQDYPRDMVLLAALGSHGDAYRDHALIWRLFPGDGVRRDFLFRRDHRAHGRLAYYVVSKREPQPDPGMLLVQTKPYCPVVAEGEWLDIELRANPTITRRGSPHAKSARHDVLMDAKREWVDGGASGHFQDMAYKISADWLLGRAEHWGLRVNEESINTTAYTQHSLKHRQRRIAFSSLDYQMRAQVTDPDALQTALLSGVGHAKAFGCGLLLVKRVR